jgi:hypothetical protein
MQQVHLDTVAHLPELDLLNFRIPRRREGLETGLANFEPNPELQYVEELEIEYFGGLAIGNIVGPFEVVRLRYMLEKDGGRPVGYRKL